MMRIPGGRLSLSASILILGLIATACGAGAYAASNGSASNGSGALHITIASPASGGTVSEPFTVRLDAIEPIGDPTTGDHHVHLCFDGGSCDELAQSVIAYGTSVQVDGLSPGTHTIEASLRNADHSAAGATDTITVTVASTGGSTTGGTVGGPTGGATGGATGSGGRGY